MHQPLINIITRTSNRPKGFDRNYHSVKSQTYKNVNHIVIYDNLSDYEDYISKYTGITPISVDREKLIDNYKGTLFFNKFFYKSYHNLYFNPVLKTLDQGWIIFLDDDDYFKDENTLEIISNYLLDDNTIYIWKMLVGDSIVIPKESEYKTDKIELGNIGGSCFTVHTKWGCKVEWDAYKCADFRYLKALDKIVPNKKWLDEIFIIVPSSGYGKKKDIFQ